MRNPIPACTKAYRKPEICMQNIGYTRLFLFIHYASSRMPKTRPYLDYGFLELDNNTYERAVKPVAIGWKNCMFPDSERDGKAMTIAFTLIETANPKVERTILEG